MNLQSEMIKNFKHWKYCPHCGSGDFTEHENCKKCKACKQSFYENVAACVVIIFHVRNSQKNQHGNTKVIISKRAIEPNKGKYDFPGGFMCAGETATQAIAREVNEELSFTIDEKRLVYLSTQPTQYSNGMIDCSVLDIAFTYEITEGDFHAMRVADDVAAIELIQISDLPHYEKSCENIQIFSQQAQNYLKL